VGEGELRTLMINAKGEKFTKMARAAVPRSLVGGGQRTDNAMAMVFFFSLHRVAGAAQSLG